MNTMSPTPAALPNTIPPMTLPPRPFFGGGGGDAVVVPLEVVFEIGSIAPILLIAVICCGSFVLGNSA